MNNNNNNYTLYKKVFCNIYLSKLIFEKVSQINETLVRENNTAFVFKSSYEVLVNKRVYIYKLNKIPLDIIVSSELVEIFKDIIKSKHIHYSFEYSSKQAFIIKLIKFIIKFDLMKEFKQFYLICKNKLLSNLQENKNQIKKLYNHSPFGEYYLNLSPPINDLFQILIEMNDCPIEIIRFIYQDQIEFINAEKEYYYKVRNNNKLDIEYFIKSFGTNKYNINEESIPIESPFSIYFNKEMFKNVIENSNSLETIKFLKDEVSFDFEYYNKELIYWAFTKNYYIKDQIIYYLIDNLKFKVPKNLYDNSFIRNILDLKYKTFNKMLKNGWSIKYDYNNDLFLEVNKLFKSKIYKPDYILILLHCFYIKTNNIEFIVLIKIIKLLLYYNQNQTKDNEITNDNIKYIIGTVFLKYNLNGLTSPIKKLIIFNKFKNLKINYTDFQIEREVRRIYLFEFLKTISNIEFVDNGFYYLFNLINFATDYNEYQLLYQNIELFKQFINVISDSVLRDGLFDLKDNILKIIFSKKDCQLYKFFYCDIGIYKLYLDYNKDTLNFKYKWFKSEYFNIDQIEYLNKFLNCLKDNKDEFFQPFFFMVLNIDGLKQSNVNQIISILNEYYSKNGNNLSCYLNAYDLESSIDNIELLNYINEKFNSLFLKWERCSKIKY